MSREHRFSRLERQLGSQLGYIANKKEARAERRRNTSDDEPLQTLSPVRREKKKESKGKPLVRSVKNLLEDLATSHIDSQWHEALELKDNATLLLDSYTRTESFQNWYREVADSINNTTEIAIDEPEKILPQETLLRKIAVGALFQNIACEFLAATEFNDPALTLVAGEDLLPIYEAIYPHSVKRWFPFGLSSLSGVSPVDFMVLQQREKGVKVMISGDSSVAKGKEFRAIFGTHMDITFRMGLQEVLAPGKMLAVVPKEYEFTEEGQEWFHKAIHNNHLQIFELPFTCQEWGDFIAYVFNRYRLPGGLDRSLLQLLKPAIVERTSVQKL